MSDSGDCKSVVIDNVRTLLHKCLSQFNCQQQIHAQQAVQYIQGFGDGIPSHQSIPMMSALLISYVKDSIKLQKSTDDNDQVDNDDGDNDDLIEHPRLKVSVNKDGKIIDTHQVHHYVYRADSLSHLCFFDFVHRIRIETKVKDKHTKNTHESRLGVLKRHSLKDDHPLSKSHILIERTDGLTGDGNEYVPHVVGTSIPRKTNHDAWALFALAHFKPFTATHPLLRHGDDPKTIFETYSFSEHAQNILQN